MRKWMIFLVMGLVPAARAQREVALTVYNQDFAVVKDTRMFATPKGTGVLTFTDVAARIDPTSVQITNPGNPKFLVREQNFENNLVSSSKLLEKMLDRPVTVLLDDGKSFTGQLLAAEKEAVSLQTGDGIKIIERNRHFGQIVLDRLPEGLLLRPALVWQVGNSTGGNEKIEIAYQTAGFTWSADYNVLLKPEQHKLDINGWVTINNTCGSGFPDAHLKLVAGEVHKVVPEANVMLGARMMKREMLVAEAPAPPPGFQERAFAEYHLYDLGRKTTLANNETKQIELFDVHDIGYTMEYLFDRPEGPYYYGETPPDTGQEALNPLKVVATIENKKENKLGIPLPAGNVRMYQLDREQADHFVGQDRIEHTPKDEKVRLTVGRAFDVVGGKKVVATNRVGDNVTTQDIVVRIRNHKATAVPVVVKDNLMGHMNWTIEQNSDVFKKIDYNTIEFRFSLKANEEKTIRYRVRYENYTW